MGLPFPLILILATIVYFVSLQPYDIARKIFTAFVNITYNFTEKYREKIEVKEKVKRESLTKEQVKRTRLIDRREIDKSAEKLAKSDLFFDKGGGGNRLLSFPLIKRTPPTLHSTISKSRLK